MKLQQTIQPRTENDMTTETKTARRKLSLLELAAGLCNVGQGAPAERHRLLLAARLAPLLH
jgi:hypothetical protein